MGRGRFRFHQSPPKEHDRERAGKERKNAARRDRRGDRDGARDLRLRRLSNGAERLGVLRLHRARRRKKPRGALGDDRAGPRHRTLGGRTPGRAHRRPRTRAPRVSARSSAICGTAERRSERRRERESETDTVADAHRTARADAASLGTGASKKPRTCSEARSGYIGVRRRNRSIPVYRRPKRSACRTRRRSGKERRRAGDHRTGDGRADAERERDARCRRTRSGADTLRARTDRGSARQDRRSTRLSERPEPRRHPCDDDRPGHDRTDGPGHAYGGRKEQWLSGIRSRGARRRAAHRLLRAECRR